MAQAKKLVARAGDLLQEIEDQYENALRDQKIPDDLLLDVKHCLESLRSPLDYIAAELHERFCTSSAAAAPRSPYFPIRMTKSDFDGVIDSQFVGLRQNNPEIVQLLESFQPFATDRNGWLPKLSKLVNENKHDQLSPQTRMERQELRLQHGDTGISIGDGASIEIGKGASISLGGARIPGGQTLKPGGDVVGDRRVEARNVTWVDFRFDAIDESALPFLRRCYEGVERIVDQVRDML